MTNLDNVVTIALGIPTINRNDLLQEALEVYKDTWYGRNVNIVDNGNQSIQTKSANQRVMIMPKNLGVSGSWNLLMTTLKNKGYSHVALLNDDIIWKRNADEIEEFIQSHPADFYQGTGTWCCFVLPIKTFDLVGKFDEGFFRSYYEDNDYAYRMNLLGLKVLADPFFNPEVYRNSATIEKDPSLNAHFSLNQKRYIDKWGGMPMQETFTIPFNGNEGYDVIFNG
jgi:GT2 family glycosyltransferase